MLQQNPNWETYYRPADPQLWSGRTDSEKKERYHQFIRSLDLRTQSELLKLEMPAIGILGFKCDEGVRRNQGRPGACKGPDAIRAGLANLPCMHDRKWSLLDYGNMICPDQHLEEAQYQLGRTVAYLLGQGVFPLLLGGGHEIAWGHYQGLAAHNSTEPLTIVNFDAHYDLRPLASEKSGNSGTSFTQILEHRKAQDLPFDYCCIGIQRRGNTWTLQEKAGSLHTAVLFAEDVHLLAREETEAFVRNAIQRSTHIYLSLCMDVFSSAYAPGVSAPQALGLAPWQVIPLLRFFAASGKVIALDVAEVSPPLDNNHQTAKLAAALISEFLHNL